MSFFCRFRRCFIIVFEVSFSSLSTSSIFRFFRRFRRRFLCRFLCSAFECKGLSRPGPGELPEIPSSAPTFIQPVPIFAPIREVCPDEISSRSATFFRLGMVKWPYHEQDRNTNNQLSTTISEYAMCEICNIKESHTVYGFFCTLNVAFLTHILRLNFPLPTLPRIFQGTLGSCCANTGSPHLHVFFFAVQSLQASNVKHGIICDSARGERLHLGKSALWSLLYM